ncbi:unnamed protein product [Strongylus vulgaris]|uniref:UmuC domain-containing protein n=1 Tax=Strongylus vulgaris TaxID=40348 RepID=A0A3P7IWK8_STRVU|nr:unnamed protein product [Strongylus vulgaris]
MRDDPRLRTIPMAVGSMAMLVWCKSSNAWVHCEEIMPSTRNCPWELWKVQEGKWGEKPSCTLLLIFSMYFFLFGLLLTYISKWVINPFLSLGVCSHLIGSFEHRYEPFLDQSVVESIFAEYDEDLSMGSLDEAYIDLTAYVSSRTEPKKLVRRQYGGECICKLPLIAEEETTPSSVEKCAKCGKERKIFEDEVEFGTTRAEVVREIRFRVEQATGLTCSAGIAPNFKLAKICSDMNKPNGQYELENSYEAVMEFLHPLPIRKVGGIGRVSEALLNACDIRTVGELLERRAALTFSFSPLAQESFLRIALGLPGRPSASDPRRKSISTERTFTPTSDRDALLEMLKHVCEMLAEDMPKASVVAKTLEGFEWAFRHGKNCVIPSTKYLLELVDDRLTSQLSNLFCLSTIAVMESNILAIASETLDRELPNEIRLLGVRLSNLQFTDDRHSDTTISVSDASKPCQT